MTDDEKDDLAIGLADLSVRINHDIPLQRMNTAGEWEPLDLDWLLGEVKRIRLTPWEERKHAMPP